ncbi:MAG: MotA/TolQ/ExbB proton channel family protein, partial [Rhodoferax sp.]|nr:MotA/TolQ/ExbB proton channel family protein [Rhodoferax sp.]
MIASCACALGLLLPVVGALAQAQPAAPAAAASVTTAVAPLAGEASPDAAAAPKKAAEVSDNPYGIEALWKTSDAVAKTVLMLLLVMSVSSWYVLIVKLFEQSKISRQGKLAANEFWSAGTVQQGCAKLDANSPFRFIAEAGLDATKKHDGLM